MGYYSHLFTNIATPTVLWRPLRTVEIVLFEISNSMKPYPSVLHAYISRWRPVTGFFEPRNLDEVSNCIPPTSQIRTLITIIIIIITTITVITMITIITIISISTTITMITIITIITIITMDFRGFDSGRFSSV